MEVSQQKCYCRISKSDLVSTNYRVTPINFDDIIYGAINSDDTKNMKNVISMINEEIDKLVSSNGKEANSDKLTDEKKNNKKTKEMEDIVEKTRKTIGSFVTYLNK